MNWTKYEYDRFDRSRSWYEHSEKQLDASTATVWALHLHMPDASDESLKRVLDRGRPVELTGEYAHGDSWKEWGEESKGDDDCHMVLYYKASPTRAYEIGKRVAYHAALALDVTGAVAEGRIVPEWPPSEYAISTAGDYAEQVSE